MLVKSSALHSKNLNLLLTVICSLDANLRLSGLRSLILQWGAQHHSCSQGPWLCLRGFSKCLTPWYKDSPWVILLCLWGWTKWCRYISLLSHRTNSEQSGKTQLLWSWCLLQDHTCLQEHWVNVIISWRKCKKEKYVLPLILLLNFPSAAHTFLTRLVFLLLTKSQVAVNKAIFVVQC